VENPRGPVPPVARKKQKTIWSPEEQERTKKQRQKALLQRLQERRLYDEMVVKAFLLGHIRYPYIQKLREAIRNRVDSCSKSVRKASLGLMRMAGDIFRDVTHMETVEIPDEFFDKTCIGQLILGTEESRKENGLVHGLHEKTSLLQLQRHSVQG